MIESVWPVQPLHEVTNFQEGPGILANDFSRQGTPLVRLSGLGGYEVSLKGCNFVDPDKVAAKWGHFRLRKGDILVSTSASFGRPAVVGDDAEGALFYTGIIRFNPSSSLLDHGYLKVFLASDIFMQQAEALASGSVIRHFGPSHLREMLIPVPPINIQRSIATVLSALDDKINLNHRMNETLETTAQTVFKEWFVDFGPIHARTKGLLPQLSPNLWSLFPDALDDDGMPVGWERTTLGALTSKIGSGATPRGGSSVYIDKGINFIRSQNVYDHVFSWGGLVKVNDDDALKLQGVSVEPNDVLINITGDSILRTCVVDPDVLPARVNQHVAIIRPQAGVPSRFLHLYLVQPSSKSYFLGHDAGGSRAAITKGHLESFPMIKPGKAILMAFQEITTPWYERISQNNAESRTLTQLRDLLLPKVLSGEIRLHDAEKSIEELL